MLLIFKQSLSFPYRIERKKTILISSDMGFFVCLENKILLSNRIQIMSNSLLKKNKEMERGFSLIKLIENGFIHCY